MVAGDDIIILNSSSLIPLNGLSDANQLDALFKLMPMTVLTLCIQNGNSCMAHKVVKVKTQCFSVSPVMFGSRLSYLGLDSCRVKLEAPIGVDRCHGLLIVGFLQAVV